jgi:outer membrane protein
MQSKLQLIVLAALAGAGVAAQAQTHVFKAGVIRYDPHSQTSGITGIGLPPGADAKVGAASTPLFTYEYRLTPNVGLDLVLGVPPKIHARATGSVAFLGEVLTARNVAPTVLLNYHFGQSGDTWRPYMGLGVNYTKFTDVTTPYSWDVKLSDSHGLAAHVGLDYSYSKNFGLFTSIGRANVRSKLVATGAVVLETTIDFRPWTYSFGASYSF